MAVAVVGASYSGLVLARTLHHLYPGRFIVKLFEKRRADNMCEVNGSINFFWARETMSVLGLEDMQLRLPAPDASKGRTDKQKLLAGLASSLPRGSVLYGARVVGLSKGKSRAKLKVVWDKVRGEEEEEEEDEEEERLEGEEFDIIVAADGLTSASRGLMLSTSNDAKARQFLLIGDAARPFGREPCCSFDRIRSGASDAMMESIEIGKALAEEGISSTRLASYTLTAWRWRYTRNTAFIAAVLLLAILSFVAARFG